jgi:hypothetical protein
MSVGDDPQFYLPADKLRWLSQRELVARELKRKFHNTDPSTVQQYIDYVCGRPGDLIDGAGGDLARRIFIILLSRKHTKDLPLFVEAKLKDKDLPLLWADGCQNALMSVRSKQSSEEPKKTYFADRVSLRNAFYEGQWKIIVPIFARNPDNEVTMYYFHKHVRMPWKKASKLEEPSGFGEVRQVTIHEAHHKFVSHCKIQRDCLTLRSQTIKRSL